MNWLDTQLGIVDFSVNTAEFALNWLLQSSLLLGLGLALGRLLRQRGSALQSVVYRTTLAAVLICPVATWGLSQAGIFGWSIELAKAGEVNTPKSPQPTPTQITDEQLISTKHSVSPTPVETTLTQLSPTPGASLLATEFDSALSTPATTEAPQSPLAPLPVNAPKTNSTNQFAITAAMLWLLVSSGLLIRLANAWRQLTKLRRRSVPADEATTLACQKLATELQVSQPAVLRSPLLPSPCLAGLWRPTILLPEQNCELSLREVLIHELAHLRRHDCHWNLLRQTATALFFFQPLLWLLSRRLEATAEEVCDDYVVQHGGNRQQYAHRLVDIAELSLSPIAAAGVGMVSLRSMLGGRVQRIMDTSRTLSTRAGNVFLVAALLVGLTGTLVAGFIGLNTKPAQAVTATETTTKAEKETDDDHSANEKDDADLFLVTGIVVNTDEKPAEGVIIRYQLSDGTSLETKSNQQGEYKLSLPKKRLWAAAFLAYAPNGQLGYARLPYERGDKSLQLKQINLAAPRELKVMVRTAAGSPVAGIELIADDYFSTVWRTTTNEKGEGTITLPADVKLQFIMAQGKQGVDYALFRHPGQPNNDPFLLEQDYNDLIKLKLEPTITAKIKVVDKENRPISGAIAFPWYITLPDHGIQGAHANLGSLWRQTTDTKGYAYFPYIPKENIHPLTIWVRKEGYISTDRTNYDPKNPANVLIATMLRTVPAIGVVVDSTGKPAANVAVQAVGNGYTTDDCRESTETDANGRFTMNVTPNMYYYFAAYGDKTAAPIVAKIIREETPAEIKLQLQPATRVFGQLTVGPDKRALADKYVRLLRHGDSYHKLPEDQKLLNPNDYPYAISSPRLVKGMQTNSEGRFEFFTGPGKHYIFGFNSMEATKFEVTKTSGEQEHDFHSPVALGGTLRGRVVLAADKQQGMSNIRVFGYPENLVGNHLRAATDENGNFETQQSGVAQLVGAFSKNGNMGAVQHVTAGSDYFELALAPTGALRGTLVHKENGLPVINNEISAAIDLTNDDGRSMSAFQKSTTTDQEGKFKITGVVPGNIYKLSVVTGRNKQGHANGWRRVGTAEPKDASVLELGKLELATPSH